MMYSASEMALTLEISASSVARLVRFAGLAALLASLAACGSSGSKGGGSGSASVTQRGTYKVGKPYKIDGITYTPREEFNYTETGVASWYGPGFHTKATANGERYDQSDRTAAHRTLQMPAVVRVTNLENGMSTVVRINDRGPFARNRIIDLSRTAAQELDIIRAGTARVRLEQLPQESMAVRDVALGGGGPDEQHQAMAAVASGQRSPPAAAPVAAPPPPPVAVAAAEPEPAPPPAPPPRQMTPAQAGWGGAPPPRSAPVTVAATPPPAPVAASAPGAHANGFYIQVGAFSTPENAERQRSAIRSYGTTEVTHGAASGREVYRVRLGPYTTSDAAGIVADRLKRSGYGDARVIAD
ncbi:MAG: septal ring lytic transglycosylase RlpA family protein [Alphaproteobacteria bacterium]|nr:septal ring lytic transglycosylase RlpA family protein [Alphaproteobacteria bacterium]